MESLKKLSFGFIWVLLIFSFYFFAAKVSSTSIVAMFSQGGFLADVVLACLTIQLSSFCFGIFSMFSQDWRMVYPVLGLGSLGAFVFFPNLSGIYYLIGVVIVGFLSFIYIEHKMKTYIDFNSYSLLKPVSQWFGLVLAVTLSVAYFSYLNSNIAAARAKIPDVILDTVINAIPMPGAMELSTGSLDATLSQYGVTEAQLKELELGTKLAGQTGFGEGVSSSLNNASNRAKTAVSNTKALVRAEVQKQVDIILEPYQTFMPMIGAVLLFLTLISFLAILGWFGWPFIALVFWGLEKLRFIHFEKEMREVRKLVV